MPMGPSLQIYSPGKGLYEEMQSATNGEEGDTLQLSQARACGAAELVLWLGFVRRCGAPQMERRLTHCSCAGSAAAFAGL